MGMGDEEAMRSMGEMRMTFAGEPQTAKPIEIVASDTQETGRSAGETQPERIEGVIEKAL